MKYAVFFNDQMEITDEIELGEIHSYDRQNINSKSGNLNGINTLFIIVDEEEKDSVTPEELVQFYGDLIISELDEQCTQVIYDGFHSQVMNAHYRFDTKDQANFDQKVSQIFLDEMNKDKPGYNPLVGDNVIWKTQDMGFVYHTLEQFQRVLAECGQHKEGNINKYWMAKIRIKATRSLPALLEIDDFRTAVEILDKYENPS
ncbi:hypothetical protein Q9251_03085 [Alkalihalobacillus macyae]|uniref:DUF4376 domain-containing protein n=1 Tax=Guptibacillus hwajinpoensis TaxID=208199 RepID=UPI00273ACE7A|nr:hypothetical protein [Alkalihalobacillus macyae]MDP4549860.1 hypothetical protein [Alkalihalobacillus macyae]